MQREPSLSLSRFFFFKLVVVVCVFLRLLVKEFKGPVSLRDVHTRSQKRRRIGMGDCCPRRYATCPGNCDIDLSTGRASFSNPARTFSIRQLRLKGGGAQGASYNASHKGVQWTLIPLTGPGLFSSGWPVRSKGTQLIVLVVVVATKLSL